ncbi:uncharacterized protein LOC125512119 [Triticum urartu]|uniref:uncharacterized protein LOC125512119 n=1 Tax=Triticum urartu TaxID=4572 RepID=UPI0020448DE2|nr:uncharacterized protein LOC125512119 [Triticum urartu]
MPPLCEPAPATTATHLHPFAPAAAAIKIQAVSVQVDPASTPSLRRPPGFPTPPPPPPRDPAWDPDLSPRRVLRSGSSVIPESPEHGAVAMGGARGVSGPKRVSFEISSSRIDAGRGCATAPPFNEASDAYPSAGCIHAADPRPAAPAPVQSWASLAGRPSNSYSDNNAHQWQVVCLAHWWRHQGVCGQRGQPRRAAVSSSGAGNRATSWRDRRAVKPHKRKCHRCKQRGHISVDCRDPIVCDYCNRQGHRLRECSTRLQQLRARRAPTVPFPPRPRPLVPAAMPRLGEPASRPAEGFVVMASTPDMDAQAAALANVAALVWLGGNRPRINVATMEEAIHRYTRVPKADITVVPHHPEDFFVKFTFPHHRDLLTAAPGKFSHGDLDIHAANWRSLTRADAASFHHHVHLCLEEVPLQAWSEEAVGKIIGSSCILHYFDIATLQKVDATTLDLRAWCVNPSTIPKVMWVTIVGSEVVVSTSAMGGRKGLTYRVIVHLDRLEDFTPYEDGSIPSRPRNSDRYDWVHGIVDGEAALRDRGRRPPSNGGGGRRRDDDGRDRRGDEDRSREEDRRGRRDDRPASWRDRFFRSRSQAADRRAEDGRREDRRDYRRDGRRHEEGGRRIDLSKVQLLPGGAVIPALGRRRRAMSPVSTRRCSSRTVARTPDKRRSPVAALAWRLKRAVAGCLGVHSTAVVTPSSSTVGAPGYAVQDYFGWGTSCC